MKSVEESGEAGTVEERLILGRIIKITTSFLTHGDGKAYGEPVTDAVQFHPSEVETACNGQVLARGGVDKRARRQVRNEGVKVDGLGRVLVRVAVPVFLHSVANASADGLGSRGLTSPCAVERGNGSGLWSRGR